MQYAFRMFSSKARHDWQFTFLNGIAAFAVLFFGVFSPAAAQSYGTGLSLLPPQEYEALPAVPRFRAFLPPSADLSEWFPAVGDQGQQVLGRGLGGDGRQDDVPGLKELAKSA